MKILREITADEMIATFLKAEIDSPRFQRFILPELAKYSLNDTVVTNPDITDPKQNQFRKRILSGYRGYSKNKELFTNFPKNVIWYRASISKKDLSRVKYLLNDYWWMLSKGKRYAKTGAKNVSKGMVIDHPTSVDFNKIVEDLRNGKQFAELILVGKDINDELVVLEGHGRVTSFLLNPELLPSPLEVIVGLSPDIGQWNWYGENAIVNSEIQNIINSSDPNSGQF